MIWVEVAFVFLVCHLVGDYLLQTDWQARHKHGGLGRDRVARRALLTHSVSYTLAFVPALAWIAIEGDPGPLWLAAIALLVFVPHFVQDDGRIVRWWMLHVKHTDWQQVPAVTVMVDQTLHLLALVALALLVAGVA